MRTGSSPIKNVIGIVEVAALAEWTCAGDRWRGFVGSNLVNHLLGEGFDVTIFDAFLRCGAHEDVAYPPTKGFEADCSPKRGRAYCQLRRLAPGDQPCYISDIRKAGELLGWKPLIDKLTGIRRFGKWVSANMALFTPARARREPALVAVDSPA
jgi:nucleoside-diphosphate-sugar epimerase